MDSNELKSFYQFLKKQERAVESQQQFAESIGLSRQYISEAMNGTEVLTSNVVQKIKKRFPVEYSAFFNTDLPTGVIPLFEDVSTHGSTAVQGVGRSQQPTSFINAGDWFPGANAAIRHFGDSMVEYPNGCILALRKVTDLENFVWGQNYVVEFGDDFNRVTKRLQLVDGKVFGYSTNQATYPDGTPIHQPIKLSKIRAAHLVLGVIIKTNN